MRTTLLVFTSALLPLAAYAQQPTLYYNFEGNSLNNGGTAGGASTAVNFNGNEYVAGAPGGSTAGTGLRLDQDGGADGGNGEFFNTGVGAGAAGFDAGDYTASGWVNLDSTGGDNMVFGQAAGSLLHNGFRNGNIHTGHWGNDTTSGLSVSTGSWNHYAWTQLTPASFGAGAPANAQFQYQNGYIVASSGSGQLANGNNVTIGSSGNGGGLLGTIDDVAAWSDPLRPNQVQYLAAGGSPLTLPAATGYLPASLPGMEGTQGAFSVFRANAAGGLNMNHIDAAVSALRPGNPAVASTATGSVSRLNLVDPNTNASAGTFGGDIAFPGDNPGADDNNFAFVAKGVINVPSAGNYSFNVRGDDGFAMRIVGQTWSGVTGGGGLDPLDSRTMYFAGGTGDSNTTGTVNLAPGQYNLEFVGFEGGGGASQEITVSVNGGPSSLLGSTATSLSRPGVSAAGWSVTTSATGGTALNTIADAQADLLNNPAVSAAGVASINYTDPDPGVGAAGSIAGDIAFPNDIAGIDDEDFSVLAQATLVIPFDGVYRIGFQGDDGGYLRIQGVTGWSIVENATGAAIVSDSLGNANAAGDTLWTNALTGNSRTIGQISLTAGSYNIEGLFFERGGGANWEIFGSGVEDGLVSYALLAANGAGTTGGFAGVGLVPEPSSIAMLLAGSGFLLRRRRK
jgi:hypothetical protein